MLAQRLTYALDHSLAQANERTKGQTNDRARLDLDRKRLRQAADILRTWNGQVDAASPAPSIVNATRAAIWSMLLEPYLGGSAALYTWGEKSFAEEQIVMHTPDRWLPKPFHDWDEFLTAAINRGLRDSGAPGDLAHWSSGKTHPVDIEHPIFGQSALLRFLIDRPTGTGVQPQSGDTSTVKQVDRTFGPSQRMTVDFANLDNSTLSLVLGESGNPASPYFLDQFRTWLSGTTYPMPFSPPATSAATMHTLTLQPVAR